MRCLTPSSALNPSVCVRRLAAPRRPPLSRFVAATPPRRLRIGSGDRGKRRRWRRKGTGTGAGAVHGPGTGLHPPQASWPKVDKAGATALFQQEGKGSNNIGVVVNPVRLNSLTEFGTPQFVADRLLQAEKKKESTKSAGVTSVGERSGHDGLKVYEIEYTLDSTRGGMKRIFTAAFVASEKLYLLNIAHSDSQEKPLDSQTRTVLERVLHSFDSV